MNKDFLLEMLNTESPSGFEFNMQKKIISYMEGVSDNIIKHHSGNVINCINTNSNMKVLLAGHIDEIGLMISEVRGNGLCSVVAAGGIRPGSYVGQKVNVITIDGRKVPAVIGVKSNSFDHKVEDKELFLDLGVDSKEEASKLVSPGDYVIFVTTYQQLADTRLTSRALDNKLGAFIVLEALRKAKEKQAKVGVYSLTSVGEETTMRGASFGAYQIKPTMAIIVDVTFTTADNGVGTGDVKLGKGPVLCHGSIINKKINNLLLESAKRLNINTQYEIAVSRTGTDADKIYFNEDGIPCALISIPLRYMHSPSEVCDLNDVENIIDLIVDFLINLQENENFNPFLE